MLDAQTPGIALAAVAAVLLFTILPSALIEAHTGRRTWLSRGDRTTVPPTPRSSLLVELPIVVILIGGTQLVMAAVAISATSGLVTRLTGAIELIVFLIWMTHLLRSIRKEPSLPESGETPSLH